MTYFTNLPVEILVHIFHFLDGKSFTKCGEVCKSWNTVIKEMKKNNKLWKQFCHWEIPSYVMKEILCFKSIPSSDPFFNWTTLYKKWFKTRIVANAPYSMKNISISHKNQAAITCLKLSGSWILTGHSSGHLCVWNQYTGELWQRYLCHLKSIVDMALINLLNLDYYYGLDDLPWNHHHVITISKDSYIQVISLLEKISFNTMDHLNYHSTDLKSIKVFDTLFAVSACDNTVSLWKMNLHKKPSLHLNTTLLHRIIGPPDMLHNIELWHDQIHCISYSGKLQTYNYEEDKWTEFRCLKNTYASSAENKFVTITNSFLFRDKTVILFTNDGRMVVSINEKFSKDYYLMKNLQTQIISVALKGTLLALGGENGKLYVYYVPETKHLLQLDLTNPYFSIRLSEASITSIDINFDEKTPIIIGATNESLYVVKWYSTVSSHQEIRERKLFQSSLGNCE